MDYKNKIRSHYEEVWKLKGKELTWKKGPMNDISDRFSILEFPPNEDRDMWTYATCCMSKETDLSPIELHLFSPYQLDECIELLTVIAFYHNTTANLDLWHTVNFGKAWIETSKLTHGLISLPYVDGPNLENFAINNNLIKFYWLIPITKSELEYKKKHGIEALEQKFEEKEFNYLDPKRESVV